MNSDPTDDTSLPQWSAREAELLAFTLELLQEHGYDRLSVQAVATKAKASKATMHRRWPSKADLVLAAFVEGTRNSAVPPKTGSLRGDLTEVGRSIGEQVGEHAGTMRAVLNEVSHSPRLQAVMHEKFFMDRKLMIDVVLAEAVERDEIDVSAINEVTCDLLAGHLMFRAVISDRPPTEDTVQTLIDDVLLPSLKGR